MLKSLNIRNYALIDALDLPWSTGMTAMTGETGSGKSIVLGALGLLIGDRADTSSIRTGADRCTVEGVFSTTPAIQAWLEANQLDAWDDLIIRREFSRQGRGRIFVNDTPVKLQDLQALGNRLVDLHGQDSAKLLLQREFQLAWIDSNADHAPTIQAYTEVYTAFKEAQRRLAELELKRSQPQTDLDYIQYQLDELNQLNLEDQDWNALMEERDVLENGEAIREALTQALAALSDNDEGTGAVDRVQVAGKQLDTLGGIGNRFLELAQRLTSVRIELDDLIQELTVLAEESDANPNRLDYLNALHNDLHRILHKHHAANVDELKRLQISLAEQLSDAADVDQAYAAAQQALAQRRAEVFEVGRNLMQSRQTIAAELASGIMEKLQRLSMPDARLDFTWNEMTEPDAMGIEEVTIVFSANPGHPALPLQKVASGGEKSRLMLAFKATGQGSTSIPTIVLDEIDTGVSGKVAEEMAELMHQMAQQQQVISVTHLPQVAASADHHLKVSKRSVDAATRTEVTPLGTDARVQELAGMLSGSVVTEAAKAHASALLSKP